MRLNILVLALLSSAVSAQASSIDVVVTGKDATPPSPAAERDTEIDSARGRRHR